MTDSGVSTLVADRALLGEGPLWDDRQGRLYWVDIKRHRLYWLDWDSGARGRIDAGEEITAVALAGADGLLCARRSGLYFLDTTTNSFGLVVRIEPDRPGNRPNDGGVDPLGRFWIGTMDDAENAVSGALYRLDGRDLQRILDGIGVANGVDWSSDGRTMYFTDSRVRTIWTMAFDTASGRISEPKPFVVVPETRGFPDGLTVDADDCVWSVHWDGGCITRYAPDGSVKRVIELPVSRPTACAFAGPKLDQLVITTARTGLTDEQLSGEPLAGSVLCCKPGVTGRFTPRWSGKKASGS